jgi:cysteine-rich repeat protein
MKRWILLGLLLLYASPSRAANLTCVLPADYVTRGVELCEELRLELGVRASEWSNDVCASQFLRIGLLEGDKSSTRKASRATVNQAVNDAVDQFNIDWPGLAAAFCGDGILDTEFGEECDDGNSIDGDGCDTECVIEP